MTPGMMVRDRLGYRNDRIHPVIVSITSGARVSSIWPYSLIWPVLAV